jgi:hypothetical protein
MIKEMVTGKIISWHLLTKLRFELHTAPTPLHPQSGIPFQRFPSHIVCLRSMLRLVVTAKVVPSSPSLVTLITEVIRSPETSVLT